MSYSESQNQVSEGDKYMAGMLNQCTVPRLASAESLQHEE